MALTMKRFCTLLFLAMGAVAISCMEDEPFKRPYEGFNPRSLQDGWEISTPEDEGVNRQRLDQVFQVAYREDRFRLLRSITVVRNGKIIAETYACDPEDLHRIQNVKSVTKSFVSVVTGIALQRKVLDSLNQPLSSIFPECFANHPDKKDITLSNALTMRTGLQYNDEEHAYKFRFSSNVIDYILSSPLNGPPDAVFFYSDDNATLVSYAIQRKYGKPMADFANEFLFKPLGITDWHWESLNDGISFGGSNMYLKPRDMAKFGQMLLQNGKWQGHQIVDSAWIAEAASVKVQQTGYGYYFWILRDLGAYQAAGHGGQSIIVVPGKNLVVVVTAWPYMTDTMWLRDNFEGTLLKEVIAACN
jgi:CubicO group peptidase (beta-lactamase class C family)